MMTLTKKIRKICEVAVDQLQFTLPGWLWCTSQNNYIDCGRAPAFTLSSLSARVQ